MTRAAVDANAKVESRARVREIYRRMQLKSTARVADEDKQLHARCVVHLPTGRFGFDDGSPARPGPARPGLAGVVRVRPPGNRVPSGQIDSGSSGDDAIRTAMADTDITDASRRSVRCNQVLTLLHL